jgi:3',5'-cyclic AMP phosphodiesterase CpdA
MGNMKLKILLPVLIFVFSGCDEFELRGFFTTYENANERFQESNEWNNQHGYTEITISGSTYTINAFGDSHVGGTENLDAFFRISQDEDVTAVVMAGDITTGHKDDYDLFTRHLPLKDSLQFFATAGNHDLYFDGWQHFYSIFGSASYFFIVNTPGHSDLFICLDTGSGTLGSLQLEWFKKLLEASRSNYRYCTVFTHNNLFRFRPTTSTNPMVEEIRVLLDLFVMHNVNMVVTAHDHKRNYDILGNTVHIIMDALLDENDEASYLKLSIGDEKIDFSFVDL